MPAYDESQNIAWMNRIEGGELGGTLAEIAALPAERRRAAIADPIPYLDKAGLRPPEGAQVSLLERRFDDPDFPLGLDFPPKLVWICFEVCVWATNDEGFVRRCWLQCIRI